MPWSKESSCITKNSDWLHEMGDIYLDARRSAFTAVLPWLHGDAGQAHAFSRPVGRQENVVEILVLTRSIAVRGLGLSCKRICKLPWRLQEARHFGAAGRGIEISANHARRIASHGLQDFEAGLQLTGAQFAGIGQMGQVQIGQPDVLAAM